MSHAHSHAQVPGRRAFVVGVGLNVSFIIVEVIFGLLSGSMALVTDAVHNVSDVLGLGLAWLAVSIARHPTTISRTYGLRKSTVLAALANATMLLVAVGGMAFEAVRRLQSPETVEGWTMIIVAAVGVLVNGGSALLFMKESKGDLNLRAAFVHLAADAAVSVGVIAAGAAVLWTGQGWIDPLVSLVISVVIVVGTWSLLRKSLDLALDSVPEHIDMAALQSWLGDRPGVQDVHDLHVWALSTTDTALTVHLTLPGAPPPAFFSDIQKGLLHDFQIHHVTVQVETSDCGASCALNEAV